MPRKDIILIIGNGRSVLDYSFGEQINNFPVVSRINNYSTIKYKNNVGYKTDIWFNGANSRLKTPNPIPDKIVVAMPSSIIIKKFSLK